MKKGNISDRNTIYKIAQELLYLTDEPDDLLGCHCRIIGRGSPHLADLMLVLTDENGEILSREQVGNHLLAHGADERSLESHLDALFLYNDDLPEGAYVEYLWESIEKAEVKTACQK